MPSSSSTGTASSAASTRLTWVLVQPAHQPRSCAVPGPKAVNQRRPSSTSACWVSPLGQAARGPALQRRPVVLVGGPGPARPAAHDFAFGGKQKQHPAGHVLPGAADHDLGAKPRVVGGQLGGGGLTSAGQGLQHDLLGVGEPALEVTGDPGDLQHRLELRRSRAATAREQAACRTGATSRLATKTVRRIASSLISLRSS